jgi:pseudouridine synthase
MRLNKYLAHAGIASRRQCDALIRAGRVSINGKVADELGLRIDPRTDRIALDGQAVLAGEERVYYALHKPPGYLTTVTDPFGRPTVMALVRDIPQRIYPVGRLDNDTEGLLLLTNDGVMSQLLVHPRYGVEKEYEALVHGRPAPETIRKLEAGIPMENRLTAPARVRVGRTQGEHTWLHIVIHEGRKRQIRHMCSYVGHPVIRLKRIRVGPVCLGTLPPGAWRALTGSEVEALRACSAGGDAGQGS